MMKRREPKNKSVTNIARIARKYHYKMEIIYVNTKRAFLSISDNSLKSPYERHLTSNICNSDYIRKVFYENEN